MCTVSLLRSDRENILFISRGHPTQVEPIRVKKYLSHDKYTIQIQRFLLLPRKTEDLTLLTENEFDEDFACFYRE
jgi:hypothetical protein